VIAIKTIVLPTDSSACSRKALTYEEEAQRMLKAGSLA